MNFYRETTIAIIVIYVILGIDGCDLEKLEKKYNIADFEINRHTSHIDNLEKLVTSQDKAIRHLQDEHIKLIDEIATLKEQSKLKTIWNPEIQHTRDRLQILEETILQPEKE